MKASEIRAQARQKLAGKWGKAALLTLVFAIVTYVISLVLGLIPVLGNLLATIISIPLSFGFIVSMFHINDDKDVTYFGFFNTAFDNFGKVWSIVLQTIIKLIIPIILLIVGVIIVVFGEYQENTVISFLGSILYLAAIIYCILKGLNYSLAQFILNDNPTISGKEAVEKSAELMQGKVGSLICLYLSFIGWGILAACTLGIGFIWLLPYMRVSEINFYRNLAETNEDAPEEVEEPIVEE